MPRIYFPPYPLDYRIALIIIDTELRVNNSETTTVVQLHEGDQTEYPQLEGLEVYDHNSAVIKLQDAEWQPIEINLDEE